MPLLVQLLEWLPWPTGANSKLITLAQCRCPTAHLLMQVDSVDENGIKRQRSLARSMSGQILNENEVLVPRGSATNDATMADAAEVFEQNRRRVGILVAWQELRATCSDAAAKELGASLSIPRESSELVGI